MPVSKVRRVCEAEDVIDVDHQEEKAGRRVAADEEAGVITPDYVL
jgi:hypothetical protein